jgi:predicted metal-dependent hydrolase
MWRHVQLELPFVTQAEPLPRVEFVRMRRARRYILRLRPDGTVRVTVPRGGSRREAEAFVVRNRKWIERERLRVDVEHAPVQWLPGSEILLRGEPVRITLERAPSGCVIQYGGRRVALSAPADDLRAAIESDLRQLARIELIPRLHELAGQLGLPAGAVRIRNQRSRWGSCARNGNIALNFRLVQMPPAVRDYVLIHELMHVRQQNHSRRFWRLVEAACPRFRAAERWLRTTGRSLF